jgi:MFS transporter, OFA family, oxalate/formate antiporter
MQFETRGAGVPFHPRRFPFFYGWIILGLSSLGMLMSIPGQTMGVSVFTDHLMVALDLSRVNLSLAYLLGTVGSALLLAQAGKLLDRIGARLMGTAVVLLLGLTLFGVAGIDGIRAVFARVLPSGSAAITGFLLISGSFFFMRFLGQGLLTLISRNMAMKWFDRRRGFANAVIGIVVSFGFSAAPMLLHTLIEGFGWRGAMRVMGAILLFGFSGLFVLFARDNPFICGLQPDGDQAPTEEEEKTARLSRTGPDYTLTEAKRTLTFWVYAMTLVLFSLIITAVTFHIISIFDEAGMGPEKAVSIFLPAAAISLVFNVGASWASDRLPLKIFLFIQLAGLLIELVAVAFLNDGFFFILMIVGHGISGGIMNLLSTVVWPRIFGIKHLGSISGFAMGMNVAGSAVGPYLFSLYLSRFGSYANICWILGFIGLVIVVLAIIARPPVKS